MVKLLFLGVLPLTFSAHFSVRAPGKAPEMADLADHWTSLSLTRSLFKQLLDME